MFTYNIERVSIAWYNDSRDMKKKEISFGRI
ncbi:hypothetical protein VP501E541_P0284 [Vibrio phage 501E54-1]|nr:hypothetical protein VP501E541_P0284 [Vibrio phage 501E54-1]